MMPLDMPGFPIIRTAGIDGMLVSFGDRLSEPANRAALAFRAALEKLFPPGTEGVELACDADFAVKDPARMRAKVDEYRSEHGTDWPRAKRLSDCLRASVVTCA